MSCLRTYTPAELREMTDGLGDAGYAWEIGRQRCGIGPAPITASRPEGCTRRSRRTGTIAELGGMHDSRSDGVVDWRACVDPAGRGIEAATTHCGMVAHAPTLWAVAAAISDFAA